MARMIDVTRPIFTNMTVWPGDDSVLIERVSSILNGNKANISNIHACVHSGTHVDAPLHFIPDGKSVDRLDISLFTGTVLVIDAENEKHITEKFLKLFSIKGCKAVFFKTSYSGLSLDEPFDANYTAVEPDAAEYLVGLGVKVVGIDTLSVEKYDTNDFTVHKTLLRNEVLIVEGLCLKDVIPGKYKYICMPALIKDSDGAPARVVLIQDGLNSEREGDIFADH
ncbi:kynurenine formamidase KynB [Thermoclostridium stercorarium subsp. thermolacticum DSM 2910]|jgi:arylformamidase|uniref:Kynurenine formamidase n=2 Tax=Thermoclostridium stercorarium TaxID=1510 RepID=A0A1B1YJA9_THEST|nr:cyclase family protein [Thermoclostridium stercorarium]ANW98331.1 kynurenine formamidase KynB [Thermoclostridium stercorarium subsp. thermolacticum DSM 2910]ANX00858.1 kynurenine formamidase KynB [Thermoclostridium stercorarium subsp. leptospartum DSM 9219]